MDNHPLEKTEIYYIDRVDILVKEHGPQELKACLPLKELKKLTLIQLRNNIGKAWHNIEALLHQRNEDIPKLVGSAKEYGKYEAGVLGGNGSRPPGPTRRPYRKPASGKVQASLRCKRSASRHQGKHSIS